MCIQTSPAAACQDEDKQSQGQVIWTRLSLPLGRTACASRPDPSFHPAWLQGRDNTSLRAPRGLETSVLCSNTFPEPTVPQRCQAAGLRLRPAVCLASDSCQPPPASCPCPARGRICTNLVGTLISPALLPHFRVQHANVFQGRAELEHSQVP